MRPVCDNAGAVDDMSGVNVEAEGEPAGGRQTIGQVGEGGGVVVALRYFPSRAPRVRVGLTHLGA